VILDVSGLLLAPPGLGGDRLADHLGGPGVGPAHLDGGDPQVVTDDPWFH